MKIFDWRDFDKSGKQAQAKKWAKIAFLREKNDYPQFVQLLPTCYILSRITGFAILVTFTWPRDMPSTAFCARLAGQMDRNSFHLAGKNSKKCL